jgi:hypothetical protein
MKVHVITDDKGNVVGTVQAIAGSHGDSPVAKPMPLAGQKVHELDLPKELEGSRNADELHRKLKEHLR